jgi:hypothetical protein
MGRQREQRIYYIYIQVYIICMAQFLVFKDTRRPPARLIFVRLYLVSHALEL